MTASNAIAETQIEAAIQTMFDRFVAGDADGVEHALHHDCTVWDVFQPDLVVGRDARLAYHKVDQKQAKSRGPLDLRVEPLMTTVWGDLALARYLVRFAFQPPNATSGTVRVSSVLKFEDGRWQIVHHQEGMMPSGIPSTDER